MRCGTSRKRISDELDGALGPRKRLRLEAHLRTCPACRAYRNGLGRIQAGVALSDARPSGSWASFERALGAKLDAAGAGREPVRVPFAARRGWAWGAAAAMVLAGAAVWFALLRPEAAVTETWVAYDDVLDPLVQAAEASPELAGLVDREVRASLEELTPAPDAEAAVLPAADPLFWEGLSEDELRAIITVLEAETGSGGPQ